MTEIPGIKPLTTGPPPVTTSRAGDLLEKIYSLVTNRVFVAESIGGVMNVMQIVGESMEEMPEWVPEGIGALRPSYLLYFSLTPSILKKEWTTFSEGVKERQIGKTLFTVSRVCERLASNFIYLFGAFREPLTLYLGEFVAAVPLTALVAYKDGMRGVHSAHALRRASALEKVLDEESREGVVKFLKEEGEHPFSLIAGVKGLKLAKSLRDDELSSEQVSRTLAELKQAVSKKSYDNKLAILITLMVMSKIGITLTTRNWALTSGLIVAINLTRLYRMANGVNLFELKPKAIVLPESPPEK